jgi:hypothetical protein
MQLTINPAVRKAAITMLGADLGKSCRYPPAKRFGAGGNIYGQVQPS